MPELPDVEAFRRYLSEHATGHLIERVTAPDAAVIRNTTPQGLGRALKHRRFGEPERHGKWLFASTHSDSPAGGPTVVLHFGMTGYLNWTDHDEPRHEHDRVIFICEAGELRVNMVRKLGGVWLASDDEQVSQITGPLGPDAWELSREDLGNLLEGRDGGIKSALMDQKLMAGIGNLVADETLWQARIHPRRAVSELDDDAIRALHTALRQVLEESVSRGHVPRDESRLTSVRDVDDPSCPRCGEPIEEDTVVSRTTYWCPSCQTGM
ncbi:MAG: Fpg/Nei family DNA glycosylase [Actinomycetota bacterium]|nr:Fpg/Nei family DNA glycosylase [Actinomycetota bacterium]